MPLVGLLDQRQTLYNVSGRTLHPETPFVGVLRSHHREGTADDYRGHW